MPPYAVAFQPPAGGLGLGAGGLGIPIRKCSPVAFFFQRTFWSSGRLKVMAPFCHNGQLLTHKPSYQHSSGYSIIGGLPFSGFGIKMSVTHTSTQLLQPLHTCSLKIIGLVGIVLLGNIRTSSGCILFLLRSFPVPIIHNGPRSSLSGHRNSRKVAHLPWFHPHLAGRLPTYPLFVVSGRLPVSFGQKSFY